MIIMIWGATYLEPSDFEGVHVWIIGPHYHYDHVASKYISLRNKEFFLEIGFLFFFLYRTTCLAGKHLNVIC